MRRVFIDDLTQQVFERDGGVLIPDFLSRSELNQLVSAYHELPSDLNQGFHASIHSKLPDYRQKVSALIQRNFGDRPHQFIDNYKYVFSNYTVKEPGGNSNFEMHLDWTMVDESKYSSITIWLPLVDLNMRNGHLWVLKGSHQFGKTIRGGPGLNIYSEREFGSIKTPLYQAERLMPKAGDAWIYDHRLFHGSPVNETDQTRLAINYTMIPNETESWHYHLNDQGDFDIYEVRADFYNRHIIGEKPASGVLVGTEKVKDSFLNQAQIDALYNAPN